MGSACIKAGNDFPVFIFAHRKLGFVSVPPGFFHTNHLLNTDIFKASDSLQISLHLIFLKFQLLLIRKELQLTAPAGSGRGTAGLHTVFRGFQHFHQTGIAIVLFHFHNLGFYLITNHGIFHEKRIAIRLSDALSVVSHIFYIKCYRIILLKFHERRLPAHNWIF